MKDDIIKKLKQLQIFNETSPIVATDESILKFELKEMVVLPIDLKIYFKLINGSKQNYDEHFFKFYSLNELKSINQELIYHTGLPDYSNILNELPHCDECYVICDYEFHLITYVIRLFKTSHDQNPVYVVCGDKYKQIANTFSEFLDLYMIQSDELFI